jgi:hypothetical protein
MSSSSSACEYMIDLYGLRALCNLPSAKKEKALEMLAAGQICFLAIVWQDLNEIMPELTEHIDGSAIHKLSMKGDYRECAAAIVEQSNSGILPRPYDSYSDLYTASACRLHGLTLLTANENIAYYKQINACNFTTIDTVV